LKRKEEQGLLKYTEEAITVGKPASTGELLLNFLLGFLMGYKIIGAFTIPNALNDPQSFIFPLREIGSQEYLSVVSLHG